MSRLWAGVMSTSPQHPKVVKEIAIVVAAQHLDLALDVAVAYDWEAERSKAAAGCAP